MAREARSVSALGGHQPCKYRVDAWRPRPWRKELDIAFACSQPLRPVHKHSDLRAQPAPCHHRDDSAPAPTAHAACALHGCMNAYAGMQDVMPKGHTRVLVFACEPAGDDGEGPVPVAVHSRIQLETTSCAGQTSFLPRRGGPPTPEPLCCRQEGLRGRIRGAPLMPRRGSPPHMYNSYTRAEHAHTSPRGRTRWGCRPPP